ncbi:hypothetical protein KILIM_013_00130 [Kineosphaera limosa NBRC 100340]|uniref:DUF368 domain-containing protein n=2 Tax=Kineosphaera TaxID=211469 RepID=K6VFB6_9MICO|nr:hypothetical protein KILIM_013_00130 [Kineosphaera limosa NBRC 100340]
MSVNQQTPATAMTDPTPPRGWGVALPQLARGAVMGAADIVPGISGGTVALVLGIYRQLIEAIHLSVAVVLRILKADLRGAGAALKRVPWIWLGALGVGILSMVFIASGPLSRALATYPVELAGLFLGLIAGAIVLCWRQLEWPAATHYVAAAIWAVATFVLLGLSPASTAAGATPPWWAFFVGGAIAICAMILPGISGSFLLVLMGLYAPVIGAVAQRDLLTIAIFALGCATGIALASSALRWLLSNHHDLVIASMVGLMLGANRILWPWPGGLESTALELPGADNWLLPTVLAVLGFVIVLGLEAIGSRLSGKTAQAGPQDKATTESA